MKPEIMIALDFPTGEDALRFLDRFGDEPLYVKVGMELFYSEGPAILEEIKKRGHRIFLDLKLHDIPNTVKSAMRVLARAGVSMTNVHAAGGRKMMEAALEGLQEGCGEGERPKLIAVTQLTSTSEERMQRELACGFCSLVVSALLLSCPLADERWLWVVAVFLGCGLGWTTSRYLLSYIRICEHCERGTAQSSYMLGWDMGLLAGFSCSAGLWGGGAQACSTYIILGLCAATGLFHFLCVKPWYMQNKRK